MGKLRCLKPLLTGLLVMIFSVAAACALTDTRTPAPGDAVTDDVSTSEYVWLGAFDSADASADDGETTGYVRSGASDSDSDATDDAPTGDGGDTTAPVVRPGEPDSDSAPTENALTSEYVWLGAFDSADAYADDGETTGYVRPAKTSGSGAV
ncbi:MAG: hypothetical protein IJK52_02365, partial [Oscillospiraceae bacterium]|nr:hypothetical protein [Oscillospiraceae bacterium]